MRIRLSATIPSSFVAFALQVAIISATLLLVGGRRIVATTTAALFLPRHPAAAAGRRRRRVASPRIAHTCSPGQQRGFVSSHGTDGFDERRGDGQTDTMETSSKRDDEEAIKILRRRKQSLRKEIRSRMRSNYPLAEADALAAESNKVFSRLFDLPQYHAAESVGFFLSMPSGEIQTRDAVRRIVEGDGKALFVPRVGLDFERCDMDLVRCDTSKTAGEGEAKKDADGAGGELFYDSWPRNKWGIPEPPTTDDDAARPGDIDLLLVPGLAFDGRGHRLGQGKGYYDRFIARMRDGDEGGETKPLLVGVCLKEQFLEEVPHGVDLGEGDDGAGGGIIPVSDHDYIMDVVLTPSRTLIVPKTSILQ